MRRISRSNDHLNRSRRSAFSLVEASICTLIVGVMLVSALRMVGVSARARQVTTALTRDNGLAVSLLSEILQARYAEAAEDVMAEGSEQLLASYDSSVGVFDDMLERSRDSGVGQYFLPSLPPEAVAYRITRIKYRAKLEGSDQEQFYVSLRAADAGGLPTGSVLASDLMTETTLPVTFSWIDHSFADVPSTPANQGMTLLLEHDGNYEPAMRWEANANGTGLLRKDSPADDWQLFNDQSLRFYAYGTVLTVDESATSFGLESPETGSSRADYDDVDDYDQWSASPPEERDGMQLAGYDGWTRSVTVEYVDSYDPDGPAVDEDLGLKRITVTVTDPEGRTNAQVAYRARTGVYEQEADLTKTYTSWIGLKMQIGSDDPVVVGTDLLNEPVKVTN